MAAAAGGPERGSTAPAPMASESLLGALVVMAVAVAVTAMAAVAAETLAAAETAAVLVSRESGSLAVRTPAAAATA